VRQYVFEARMRRQLADADEVVTLSEVATAAVNRIFAGPRARTITLPALPDTYRTLEAVPSDPPLLIAAGRLVAEKGFATLIDSFALLNHPTARLIIIGSGPDEPRLRARIAARRLGGRVDLAGYVADIRPWLDRSRLFVLSSQHEGYAAVIVEALAAGRQVVATDCTPAAAELLDTDSMGRVVPIDDPFAMAAAIRATLALPAPDPSILAARVTRFRIGPIALAYLNLMGLTPTETRYAA
jgi:glycosyltransferase involved in cell wall biosynthesis